MSETPPGKPGIKPRWTSSAKTGVGTAIPRESRVWFTMSHGIIDEIYHPFIDTAAVRDFGLLIADGRDFFSEEKRNTLSKITPLAQGVPGYHVVNTCRERKYEISKIIITNPHTDVLLQRVRFTALEGMLGDYTAYALLSPHLGDRGADNDGWVGDFRGVDMLFARRGETVLALGLSTSWAGRSCGYVGTSDGWEDVRRHKRMLWHYAAASEGNIALTGAIGLAGCGGEFTLALAFGRTPEEAGQKVRASLISDFQQMQSDYIEGWTRYQKNSGTPPGIEKGGFDLRHVSTAILKTHESKIFSGGIIASLSFPWGFSKGDDDVGGYHVVWPRDQVEAAGAMLASNNAAGARATLFYLICTQHADGHWPQNMWLDGRPYWPGLQVDETAFPILLADKLHRSNALENIDPWPMVRLAAQFLVQSGPVSPQDRWEENSGYSVFTLATEVAALLAAADLADNAGEKETAQYFRETADSWNDQIESWTYIEGGVWGKTVGVDGYYIRIAPPEVLEKGSPDRCTVRLKNLTPGSDEFPAAEIVSVDALALVRFGLRAADDPRIINTVKVIDAALKTETATGPVWHRYNHDGYGEKEDGQPFDSVGIGRGWPLLAGERAHYEIAAGRPTDAQRLLEVMAAQTSAGGLLPEQVWDAPDIPERDLHNGHPSGSGMPLVWAHSEFLKLSRSIADGKVFDLPPQTVQRYIANKTSSDFRAWRFNHRLMRLDAGKTLRVEVGAAARIRWTHDDWATSDDVATRDTGLKLYIADLPTAPLGKSTKLSFTFFWIEANRWEGKDFAVEVV